MTPKPRTISADETIEECLFLMREYGFRHLLVADGQELKGVVSLRDILMKYLAEKESDRRREAS
jgi:CBS domain-containing protein